MPAASFFGSQHVDPCPMRLPILAFAALALAACGNNDESDTTQNIDENLAAESIVANDVTAIDAVTADAANMPADVDINFTEQQQLNNGSAPAGQGSSSKSPKASSTAPRSTPPSASNAPSASPTTNATANPSATSSPTETTVNTAVTHAAFQNAASPARKT